MKNELTKTDKLLCSWWLFGFLILLQFIVMPVATRNFSFEAIGNIISYTLGHALIQGMYGYSWIWQIITITFLVLSFALKGKFRAPFMVFAGISYMLYMIIQNVAVTEKYGISIVTGNIILMGLTSFVWLRDAVQGKTDLRFANLGKKTWWLVAIAVFCIWWPLNMQIIKPYFNPALIITGGSSLAYCAMTPVFLAILMLNKPNISLATYRVTSMTGVIIGFWNLMNFGNPHLIWLAVYHLPLFLLSAYALVDSWRLKKHGYV